MIIDIYGYFGQSSSFIPLGPKRVLDTRNTSKVPAKSTRCYSLAGAHGIPQQIKAIAFNATALAADGPGFLQVYTEGLARPVTSTINYQTNTAIANNALVQPGTTGKICVYNLTSAHYILDVVGYWLRNQTGDPCAGITCNNPPTPICTGTQVIASYAAKGSCKGGICVYTPSTKTCAYKCENAKCIPKPATPPPTTPTFQYHPVTSWQTSQDPVRSGSYMDLKALRYITIHYNGGNLDLDGPDNVYQDADMAQILRNTQRDYVVNRGYSLGYNSAVAPDGDEWEIRGLRYRAASNGCTKVNRPAYTIFVPLPSVSAKPTTAQVQGINAVIARIRAAAKAAGNPNHLTINGHRDVRPQCGGGTACPGVQLYQMIQNGTIGPK